MERATTWSTQTVPPVVATVAALTLIARLTAQHGQLVFHQTGGCRDGGSLVCHPEMRFTAGPSDRLLGYIGGAPFYIAQWHDHGRNAQLIVDAVDGPGTTPSLETPLGLRFVNRPRVCDAPEWRRPARPGTAVSAKAATRRRSVSSWHS